MAGGADVDLDLDGKVALITGGNKGFGAASARRLASEGAKIFLTARDQVQLDAETGHLTKTYGGDAHNLSADLTTADGAERVAAAALEAFGRIDILVNCAGAAQGGLFWEIPDQVWHDALDLKLMGTVRMMRAVVPRMRKQGYGRIVTIVGSFGRQPAARALPSAAANAALLTVNKGLADEVATDGIVVNAINPGPSRTGRWNTLMANLAKQSGQNVEEVERGFTDDIPMQRFGEPDEVARIVTFLASDAAANMTGTSITADGGWTKAPW